MDETVREVLERPFPPEQIRTRKGNFGKELAYAEVHNYIARLNEAFRGDWSFDIVEHRIEEEEVVVLGRLTVDGVVKTAFGGSAITRCRETGERVSITDDLKSAASDSLKKCSSLLGIGLSLYGEAPSSANPEPPAVDGVVVARLPQPAAGVLTDRQLRALLALAVGRGGGEVELRTRVLDLYSVPLEQLNRRQASELISRLQHGSLERQAAGGHS